MTQFIDHLSSDQAEELTALYHKEWWCKGRTLEDVKHMLEKSNLVFGIVDQGKLIGFARVLSDFTYKAFLFDIIIAQDYRGKGLSIQLMDAILTHPDLAQTKHFELYCLPELVPYYEKYDFTILAKEKEFIFMRYSRE